MKILIDVRLMGRASSSGIPMYTRYLLDHLLPLASSHQITLFYPGYKKQKLPIQWRSQSHVSVLDWKVPNKVLDASSRFLRYPAIDAKTQPDIILSPHFNLLISKKTPRVLIVHDLSFLHHPYFFSSRQRFWHWLQNFKQQIASAHHLIAISEFTKQDLIHTLKVPTEKISVVYSGISPEFRRLKPTDAEMLYLKKDFALERPFILYLGALEERKNIKELIDAWALCREQDPALAPFELVIVGKRGKGGRSLIEYAKRSPAASHITFFHDVTDDERVFLYNLASVFIYPSFFEGFGFPPLEAQACGTPVIASSRTSLPEILKDSAVLVDPWHTADLAAALSKVLSSETVRKDLIEKGKANVKRFSWDKTAQEVLHILTNGKQTSS